MKEALFQRLKERLQEENIRTWFDMGLFLDRIRDNRQPLKNIPQSYKSFKKKLQSGIAFVTFDFGVDGVTIEIEKYSAIFSRLISAAGNKLPRLFWIGSVLKLKPEALPSNCEFLVLPGGEGFDDWDGYHELFHTHLSRGSKTYNLLAKKVWRQTVELTLRLGRYVVDYDIQLLVPVNVNSNPGNVPLAFAMALVSELLEIPVLNSNHDFYWEDGNPPGFRQTEGQRDHFFTNHHLGEVFSLIEVLFPWDSPLWFQMVINPLQRIKLIRKAGVNPIAVKIVTTFIDMAKFKPIPSDERKEILTKLHHLFAGDENELYPTPVDQFIEEMDVQPFRRKPVVLGAVGKNPILFTGSNLLILQPTRILKRKRIEKNFGLFKSLLQDKAYRLFFKQNPHVNIILLITGPISTGQDDYFRELIFKFKEMLASLPAGYRKRFFLALKFGKDINQAMVRRKMPRLRIEELYATADVVVLPSKSEGRGLPLVESCASGTPIVASRYEPKLVFASVVGERLDKSLRLHVFEFPDDCRSLSRGLIDLYNRPNYSKRIILHNRRVVRKRFSMEALENQFNRCLYVLWRRCQLPTEENMTHVRRSFEEFDKITNYDRTFQQIVLAGKRRYYPGISPIEFMVVLKSLIDPSYFRVEEKELKGRVMRYARHLVKNYRKYVKLNLKTKLAFYNSVESLFCYFTGEDPIVMDHSLSYRHRHRRHYPYRKLTEIELLGIVSWLFRSYVKNTEVIPLSRRPVRHAQNLQEQLTRLVGFHKLGIDDQAELLKALKSDRSFAWLPGENWLDEVRLFVLGTFRGRLTLSGDEKITSEILQSERAKNIGCVYLLVREKAVGSPIYYSNVLRWIKKIATSEIQALFDAGVFQVVKTQSIAPGAHLGQIGAEAKKVLLSLKKEKGFVVAIGEANYLTLDLLDLDSFRIGTTRHPQFVPYLGIKKNQHFIQWVPAGLSPSIAFPTPLQTSRQFSQILKSNIFTDVAHRLGKERALKKLRAETKDKYSPLEPMLKKLRDYGKSAESFRPKNNVRVQRLAGLHEDGYPWSGIMAKLSLDKEKIAELGIKFKTVFASKFGKTVVELAREFTNQHGKKVLLAWNGGYMLNAELVGKLGLPEKYIGSPLGLVVVDGKILSLPLYNKPAFIVNRDGSLSLRRVNLFEGVTIAIRGGDSLTLTAQQRNKADSVDPIFYDLLFPDAEISAKNRVIFQFTGNKIIRRIQTSEEKVKLLPVGLVVSLPENMNLSGWEEGAVADFQLPNLGDVSEAIEAGPTLVQDGKFAIDMETEGWKTAHSIATQAARVDFEHLRGPKIGVGLTDENELLVIAVNGRIRESVGVTHVELAKILIDQGCRDAIGFDPGGSVTLVVDEQLNVTPYNQNYEMNPYSLPPQPRRVGSAILCVLNEND
ncbi:MAG: glycosyltransferase [Calditrichaeota bacterium]|nr:glycosyltransferase [Calditrichota bacterium]